MNYATACRIVDARSSRMCERCGRAVMVGGSHHHRKLRSRGGTDDPANLAFLCGTGVTGCHGWVHANPAAATDAGWMVPTNFDPERVMIRSPRYGDVFLGIDGQLYGRPPTDCIRADRAVRTDRHGWPLSATH